MQFQIVCVAGTFDHIHKGHEALLLKAFDVGERVIVGITSDAFVMRYKKTNVGKSHIRKQALIDWLTLHRYNGRYDLIFIDDPYEPVASDALCEALIISEESLERAKVVNEKRRERGLPLLELIIVPMIHADDAISISSTRVRNGEIDVSGRLLMPMVMRNELAMPLGKIVEEPTFHKSVISVGDMTTSVLLEKGIIPRLIIVDNKVNRKPYDALKPKLEKLQRKTIFVESGPGFIAEAAIFHIQHAFGNDEITLEVVGEEDLLVLPVIEYAPIGSVVYYGQPQKGLVEVVVTTEKKEEVIALLKKFKVQ